ncbi:uncharacterized protein [Branchiostoma lanceolatum]|uniref:uncharacterized protein n=1 Tax=Branchiostoma lanceolatum TaxID=7740 RepID=UPI0034557371
MTQAAVVQRGELILRLPAGGRSIPPWLFLVPIHGQMVHAAFRRTIPEGEVYDATEAIRQWAKQPSTPRAFDIWQPCVTDGMTRCSDDPSEPWQLPFLAVYYRTGVQEDFITYEDILFQFTNHADERQPREGLVKTPSPMIVDLVVNDDASAPPRTTDGTSGPLRHEEDDGILSKLWNMTLSNSSSPVGAENALMATYLVDRLNTTRQLENFTFLVIPCLRPVVISDAVNTLLAVRCKLKLLDWGRASEAVLVVGDGPMPNITILEKSGQVSAVLGANYTVLLKYATVNGTSVFEGNVLRIIRRWARSGRKVGKVVIEYSSTSGWEESKGRTGQAVPFGSVFLFLKISKRTQGAPFRWRMDALSREASKRKRMRSGIDTETTEWKNTSDVITDVPVGSEESSSVAPEDACRVSDFPCPAPTPANSRRTDHVKEYLIELMKRGGNKTPQMWVIACSFMTVHLDGKACNISMEGSPGRPKRVDLHLNFTLPPPNNNSSSTMSLEVTAFRCDGVAVTKVAFLGEPGPHVLDVTTVTANWISHAECAKGFFFRPICFDRATMVACEDTVHFDKVPFVVVFPSDTSD